jgi:hypothetical protein
MSQVCGRATLEVKNRHERCGMSSSAVPTSVEGSDTAFSAYRGYTIPQPQRKSGAACGSHPKAKHGWASHPAGSGLARPLIQRIPQRASGVSTIGVYTLLPGTHRPSYPAR